MKLDDFYLELKKRRDILIISALFIIYAVYDYLWITKNTLPPTWDDAWHLMSSLNYYRILTNPSFDMLEKLIHVDWYYPPFFKFSTAFLYMVFGTSITTALMTNVIYLGILLFSTYGIGKILFNRETRILAAAIVSMYPLVFNLQRIYLIDLALTSMITLSIYILLRTENFKNFRYSLILGAVLGMTLLTKWTAVFFIAGPFIYVLYLSFFKVDSLVPKKINNKQRKKIDSEKISIKKKQLMYVLLACFEAIFIASIWYIPNGAGAYNFIKEMAPYWASVEGENLNIFSFDNLSFYFIVIINQTSFLLALVFMIGLAYLIRIKETSSLFLLSWIFLPIIVLTLQMNKGDRYTMPIMAAIAIISAFWITSIIGRKMKTAVIATVLLIGGVQVISMAGGNNSMHDSLLINTHTQIGNISLFPGGTTLPIQEEWKHEEILDSILKDTLNNERVKARGFGYIVVVPDHGFINGRTFEYYNFKMNLPFQIYNGAYIREQMFYENFLNFDYLIIKTGTNGGPYKNIVDNEYDYFNKNSDAFLLIKEEKMPDDTMLSVYRNKYSK